MFESIRPKYDAAKQQVAFATMIAHVQEELKLPAGIERKQYLLDRIQALREFLNIPEYKEHAPLLAISVHEAYGDYATAFSLAQQFAVKAREDLQQHAVSLPPNVAAVKAGYLLYGYASAAIAMAFSTAATLLYHETLHHAPERLDTDFETNASPLQSVANFAEDVAQRTEYISSMCGYLHDQDMAAKIEKATSAMRGSLAMGYFAAGDKENALLQLEEACRLNPDEREREATFELAVNRQMFASWQDFVKTTMKPEEASVVARRPKMH